MRTFIYSSFNVMEEKNDYSKLVKLAQLGDKQSRDRLAGLAQERLRTDIYRLTMQYDLTEEIVQESMLEMFKILGKLREADRFWPWLYKIALNKINLHYRDEQHHKTMSMSAAQDADVKGDGLEVVAEGTALELKDIVFAAMQQLRPRHRAVLIMRCYREMEYSLIAESMQCSEFAARMLFYRAKKSLQKQLSRSGFGKGSLLTALILFGKMTAPTEAAAAQVSVTSATASVGITAGLAGMMSRKATVI